MRLKFVVLIFCLLGSLRGQASETVELSGGKLQSLNGAPTSLKAEIRGKVVILDLWASWCGPCQESLPYYEGLKNRFGAQGLQVIAVSVDDTIKAANDFTDKRKIGLRFLWDAEKDLYKRLNAKAVPTMVVLDNTGKVLFREQGFLKGSNEKLEQLIAKLLSEKK
ncbi:TlpA family protein disulfide reductase [Bdellovibrio sp. HCB337]|uniref:TlpA family protein disulfide reductase n=1 Tax=Bdellovibrio sp. HCB337 TaxID=3394358 RepID=UPI0039A591BE